MSKVQDRKNIVKKIENAAALYREKLVGKRFIYVFDNRYIEVIYKAENFRHLTGVETFLTARRFYSYAARRILATSQVSFSSSHPYDLCLRKLQHINEMAEMAGSESFILEEIKTNTKSYKFGTTDLNFTLCMNRELDSQGNEKGDCFIVQSLRDGDCFKKSKDVYVVTHILSRSNDKKKYTDLLYMDQSATIQDLPANILELIDEGLISKS